MQRLIGDYHRMTREPAVVLVLVLPIFLIYGIGQISASSHAMAGVDVFSPFLRDRLGSKGFVLVQLSLALLACLVAVYHLRRQVFARSCLTVPVAAESIVYGLILGSAVLFLMDEAHLLAVGEAGPDPLDRWVMAAGAGLHEELLFRLLLLPALVYLAIRFLAMPQLIAVLCAVLVSSIVFASAHHWAGESYSAYAFGYRTVAGGIFAGLYLTRGFAVAVWTHSSYDFYVAGL